MRSLRQSNRNYFEATIQLRPKNKELLDYTKKLIEKEKNCEISQEHHEKYGSDLYITSRKFAMFLSRRLKKAFKGKITMSRTLFSKDRQSGKGIYRVTVCFRMDEPEEVKQED